MNAPAAPRPKSFQPVPFGRYTLLLPLATGGMGEIFLARLNGPGPSRGFDKLCAIKRIVPNLASQRDFVDRFIQEAKTLAQLSHGSIAQVTDLGMENGRPFLALEHVDGKDLRCVLKREQERGGALPLPIALYVMSRVLDALAYAHRKRDQEDRELRLVHRDISPQNILVSYEGEVKVIDFGLAKSILNEQQTNPSLFLGKYLYMSPEQAKHQPVDRRSDLYAVGLCLYELISGRHPLDPVPPGEVLNRVSQPVLPPLPSVAPHCPAEVAALVHRALQVDPAARFQTAEELRGQLLRVLSEIDPSAGPEALSRYMREQFQAEYQTERRMFALALDEAEAANPRPTSGSQETAIIDTRSFPGEGAVAVPGGRIDTPTELTPVVVPAPVPTLAQSSAASAATVLEMPTVVPPRPKPAPRLRMKPRAETRLKVESESESEPQARRGQWIWLLLILLLGGGGYLAWDALGPPEGQRATRSTDEAVSPDTRHDTLAVRAQGGSADLLAPLPAPARALSPPASSPAPAKTARPPVVRHVRPPKSDPNQPPLLRSWEQTKGAFLDLRKRLPCDREGMAILCVRYRELWQAIEEGNGTESDEQLLERVKELNRLIQGKSAG
jgi:serine/threonine protein kinase